MKLHFSIRCIAMAMLILILLPALNCLAERGNLTVQELKARLDSG